MIAAVCLNPCLDRTILLPRFQLGATNRSRGERVAAGGKGVNVALTLRRAGLEVALAAFLGAENRAPLLSELDAAGVACRFVQTAGALRQNLKLLDESTGVVTEVNASGLPVTPAQVEEMAALILGMARASDWLVLTGSMPPACPADFYARLIRDARRFAPACRVALDAEGEAFRLGVAEKPAFVKPNRHELSLYMGRALETRDDLLSAARALVAGGTGGAGSAGGAGGVGAGSAGGDVGAGSAGGGVGAVIVSDGAAGALYADTETALFAPAVDVPIVTTVGAGDAMMSGYLTAKRDGLGAEASFRRAVAAAAARVSGREGETAAFLERAEISVVP